MRDISSTTGSFGYGETSWEAGGFASTDARKKFFKNLIVKANTVSLLKLFKHYNVRLDPVKNLAICPFKSHKGGRESTSSFKYYPETNSFFCFGCRVGGQNSHGCELVANIENISKYKAAYKILQIFDNEDCVDSLEYLSETDFSEQINIMLDFSTTIRNFRKIYVDDKSYFFIEKICAAYDDLNNRIDLPNEALRRIVEELKNQIEVYINESSFNFR